MSYLYRGFLNLLVICLLWPSYLLMCIADGIFEIFGNFAYYDSIDPTVLAYMEKYKIQTKFFPVAKFWYMIIAPIIMIFVNFFNGIKETKF